MVTGHSCCFSAKLIKCHVTSANLTIITLTRGVKNVGGAQKTPILLSRVVIKWMVPVNLVAKATTVHQLAQRSAQTFVSTKHADLTVVALKAVNTKSWVAAGKIFLHFKSMLMYKTGLDALVWFYIHSYFVYASCKSPDKSAYLRSLT